MANISTAVYLRVALNVALALQVTHTRVTDGLRFDFGFMISLSGAFVCQA